MDPGEQSEELETVMSLQALSGEGSLEGFHDSAALTTQMAYVEAQGNTADLPESNPASTLSPAYQPQGWLSWLEQGLGALSSLLVSLCTHLQKSVKSCVLDWPSDDNVQRASGQSGSSRSFVLVTCVQLTCTPLVG